MQNLYPKDNIIESNRNLDLLRIIQQQHQTRKLAKEISEKPENPHPKTFTRKPSASL